MIDVKEAVKIATGYMRDLYEADDIPNLLLEEVELSEDEKSWLVTLGFTREFLKPSPLAIAVTNDSPREIRAYKVVRLNAVNGQVESLKIRKL